MIKIFGCMIVLITSTLAGFVYAEKFKSRVRELNEIQVCIYQLRNQIIYTHTPLVEALMNVADKTIEPLKSFFKIISSNLLSKNCDSVYEAFKNAFEISSSHMTMVKEDKLIVLNLSKSLGETDIDGQIAVFELTIENLKKQIKNAEEIMKKSVKMYRYLGFCIGAMLVIMLV
ncbi:stage III sporulation protein SpoIIIAB [Clostridium guangxiense]|uniref:stage III sporulation protein SpoIIIAB n=1 Tax=Clostridium guangxiense TaxID=1662055 RepID=UPI001E35CB7D|nr:stage III sporulation protein SpoAB [Clostridium guangxiense]